MYWRLLCSLLCPGLELRRAVDVCDHIPVPLCPLPTRRSGWHLPPSALNFRHPSLDVNNRTANFPWRKHPSL